MRGIDPAATKGRERGASPLPANAETNASPGTEHASRLQTRRNHSWPSEFMPRKSTLTGFDGLPKPRSFAGRITVPKDARTVRAFRGERLQRGFASDQLASGGFAACFSIRRSVGNGWGLCPQTPEVFQAWPRRSMRGWTDDRSSWVLPADAGPLLLSRVDCFVRRLQASRSEQPCVRNLTHLQRIRKCKQSYGELSGMTFGSRLNDSDPPSALV